MPWRYELQEELGEYDTIYPIIKFHYDECSILKRINISVYLNQPVECKFRTLTWIDFFVICVFDTAENAQEYSEILEQEIEKIELTINEPNIFNYMGIYCGKLQPEAIFIGISSTKYIRLLLSALVRALNILEPINTKYLDAMEAKVASLETP